MASVSNSACYFSVRFWLWNTSKMYSLLLWFSSLLFLNSKGENHNHCFMDFDSLWMICLVLLKNNLINNEASNIRIETASAQPAVLPELDGKGLKWVERCQVSHSPVLCWMDKSRKSIGREKEEVGSVRPRSTLWQFCLKTYMLLFIHKLEPSRCKRRMSLYFSCNAAVCAMHQVNEKYANVCFLQPEGSITTNGYLWPNYILPNENLEDWVKSIQIVTEKCFALVW